MSETRDGQRYYDTSSPEREEPITEHPDVQRLIAETVKLQAENAKLKEELEQAHNTIESLNNDISTLVE